MNGSDVPPDITICMKAIVTPLYFLLYSTVHHLSPSITFCTQPSRLHFSSTSSWASCRIDKPSLCLALHHEGPGRVRCERCAPTWRRGEPREDPDVPLEAVTTFAPKNFFISASASRWESDTESKDAKVRDAADVEDDGVDAVTCCNSGYLKNEERVKSEYLWEAARDTLDR